MITSHRSFKQHNPRKQTGQSLIEYVIYVGLAALVLGGIIYYAVSGRTNTAVNKEASSITAWVGATQKLYNSDSSGYTNVTAQALIDNGVIPKSQVLNNAIMSGFGTPITVAPADLYGTGDGVAFDIGVPPDACSSFVQAVSANLARISVGGTVIKDTTINTPLTAAQLGTQCSGSSGANVAVILTATR